MIHIYTFAHKRPDFIEMQLRSFEKHLVGPWSYKVINNAAFDREAANYDEINRECYRLGVTSIPVEKSKSTVEKYQQLERVPLFDESGQYYNPNIACAYPICWAWDHFIAGQTDNVWIVDSDIFMIEPFAIEVLLEGIDMAFVPMTRPNGVLYAWNACAFLNMDRLPEPQKLNWWCGEVDNMSVDVGGQTHHYLKAHEELKLRLLRSQRVDDYKETGYEILWSGTHRFLHYLRGSNWNGMPQEYHARKTQWLKGVLANGL